MYLDSLDVGNRALQHCGQGPIADVNEESKNNREIAFAYDKVRRAELQDHTWTFSTRRVILRAIDTTTMLLDPREWDATVTYSPGAIVKDDNGALWYSLLPENINNEPGVTSGVWDRYFGPMTVMPYDSSIAYYAGELVYKSAGNPGGFVVFMSLQSGNQDDPATATAYDATVTYNRGETVSYSGSQWRSLIDLNMGITPADAPLDYDATAIYAMGNTVVGSDGFIYSSVAGGNSGNDPTQDGGVHWTNTTVAAAWTRVPTTYPSSIKWAPLYANMTNLFYAYPIGTGPASQSATRNVFRLPAGYLRMAPLDPKAGSTSPLGAPAGLPYDDHLIENNCIVTQDVGPMMVRFIADVTDVSSMTDMFCEAFACRIALAVCEPITQSTAKLQNISGEYAKFVGRAVTMNMIEVGPVEPPEDDFITCRR